MYQTTRANVDGLFNVVEAQGGAAQLIRALRDACERIHAARIRPPLGEEAQCRCEQRDSSVWDGIVRRCVLANLAADRRTRSWRSEGGLH